MKKKNKQLKEKDESTIQMVSETEIKSTMKDRLSLVSKEDIERAIKFRENRSDTKLDKKEVERIINERNIRRGTLSAEEQERIKKNYMQKRISEKKDKVDKKIDDEMER